MVAAAVIRLLLKLLMAVNFDIPLSYPAAEPQLRGQLERLASSVKAYIDQAPRVFSPVMLPQASTGAVLAFGAALRTVTVASDDLTITLPRVSTKDGGKTCGLYRTTALGTITVVAPDSLIDGVATLELPTTIALYEFYFDGVNYYSRCCAEAAPEAVSSVVFQVIGATGTYTKTVGTKFALVLVTGGGGGGGGADTSGAALSVGVGGGGGGGTTGISLFAGSAIGTTEAVTVGAGGAAGSDTGGAGGAGETSSFGSLLSAPGGSGGSGSGTNATAVQTTAGGAGGGSATGEALDIQGSPGGTGAGASTAVFVLGGDGGGSYWGKGRPQNSTTTTSAGGSALVVPGVGGQGGAIANASVTGVAGGAGSAGTVVVLEFV
jgi:hypothetical protein